MPSPSSVQEQLTDILARVVACPADAVVPTATLAELGTDSLTIVEVGEELGRRFGVHLSDDTINSMQTVQDAIDAIVRHDGSSARPVEAAAAPVAAAPVRPPAAVSPAVVEQRRSRARSFAVTFAFFGLVIGGVLGLGGAALVSATGISEVDLPPIAAPTTPAPTVEPTEEPTPEQTTVPDDPTPTINTSSERVSPGERFLISGAFPASPEGQDLQVEVKDGPGAGWDDFPIQTKTRDGGIYRTELYTSRTGTRQFRITNKVTGVSTDSITVEIG